MLPSLVSRWGAGLIAELHLVQRPKNFMNARSEEAADTVYNEPE